MHRRRLLRPAHPRPKLRRRRGRTDRRTVPPRSSPYQPDPYRHLSCLPRPRGRSIQLLSRERPRRSLRRPTKHHLRRHHQPPRPLPRRRWPLTNATASQNTGSTVLYAGLAGSLDGGINLGGHLFTTTAGATAGPTTLWTDTSRTNVTNAQGAFNPGGFDISSILADPHDATGLTVYATVMGFAGNGVNAAHLYRSPQRRHNMDQRLLQSPQRPPQTPSPSTPTTRIPSTLPSTPASTSQARSPPAPLPTAGASSVPACPTLP